MNILVTVLIIILLLAIFIIYKFGKMLLVLGDDINSNMVYDIDILLIVESKVTGEEKETGIKKILIAKYGNGILEKAIRRIQECSC